MTIFDTPLISHRLHILDSPLGRQLSGLNWRFPFSYDFYDRQALVLAGMTATDLFFCNKNTQSAFCNCYPTGFSPGFKRFILSLHIISGDSVHDKVFSLVRMLLDGKVSRVHLVRYLRYLARNLNSRQEKFSLYHLENYK
jgi:hypothetical protein